MQFENVVKNFTDIVKIICPEDLAIYLLQKIMNQKHEMLREGYAGHLWMWIYQVHNLPTLKRITVMIIGRMFRTLWKLKK